VDATGVIELCVAIMVGEYKIRPYIRCIIGTRNETQYGWLRYRLPGFGGRQADSVGSSLAHTDMSHL